MVNYLAVFVAAIAAFVVGALWYGPLFGKPWRSLMGVPEGMMGMPGTRLSPVAAMAINFLATLVLAYVLSGLLSLLNGVTPGMTLQVALLVWLGFVAPIILNTVLFEGRSIKFYLINTGAQLVQLLAMALVYGWWPW